MATIENTINEADILRKVIAPDQRGMSPDAARWVMDLRLDEEGEQRMRELMDKNNKGTITDAERDVMEKYRRVGMLLDLMQAKARLSLHESGSES